MPVEAVLKRAVLSHAGVSREAIGVTVRNRTVHPIQFRSVAFRVLGTGMQWVGRASLGRDTVHAIPPGSEEELVYPLELMHPGLRQVTDAPSCSLQPVVRFDDDILELDAFTIRLD